MKRTILFFIATMIAVAFFVMGINACNFYEAAWRSVAGVRATASTADKTIALVHKAKRESCQKTFVSDKVKVKDCITMSAQFKALENWIKYAKPAINNALTLSVMSIAIAEQDKKKIDWQTIIKPAVCTLVLTAQQWKHLWPVSYAAQIDVALKLLGGYACDK